MKLEISGIPERRCPAARCTFELRHALKRSDRWTPWDDKKIPATQFHQLFRMTLVDFRWLASILRKELEQDPLRR
ncbi:hypothetical protein VP01_269g4 [Puccinia sorghi]|uniref:Uncharacterized protein n=1 Tax=Puccinia sorghi TaxID=27349 RepID=A0A0L6V3T7_9BASI|nr:hypothetical protein VP01_269g4 [Puccinia sorghi]